MLAGLEEGLTEALQAASDRKDLAAMEDLLQLVVALRGALASPTAARVVLDVVKSTPAALALLRRRKPRHDVDVKRRRFDRFSDRVQRHLPTVPARNPAPGSMKLSTVYHPAMQGARPGPVRGLGGSERPVPGSRRGAEATPSPPPRRAFRVG